MLHHRVKVLNMKIVELFTLMMYYTKGGKSSYDNFVMCLKEHNEVMGTMNLHDYMKTIK